MAGELAREVLLPPVIRANLEREEVVDSHVEAGRAVDKALRSLDPRLAFVYVYPNAQARYDIVPGRWHVKRHNDPPAADSYYPHLGDNGVYREPDFGAVREMQERDLQKHGIPDPPKEEENTLRREQLRDHMLEDYRAAKRVAGENVHGRNWAKGKKPST